MPKFLLLFTILLFNFGSDFRFLIFTETGYGYIDQNGKEVISSQFEDAREFRDGYATVQVDGEWGLIDTEGKWVTPPTFKTPFEVYENRSRFSAEIDLDLHRAFRWILGNPTRTMYGYLNEKGTVVISPEYDFAWQFNDGMAMIQKEGKIGYLNQEGELLIAPQYNQAYQFSEGLAAVQITENIIGFLPFGKNWIYINKNGETVIDGSFDAARTFSNGRASITMNGRHGYIDRTGKIIIPPKYDVAHPFSDGLARVLLDGQWKFIQQNGEIAFFAENSQVYDFSESKARFQVGGKWGFLDQNGYPVISPIYDRAFDFINGLARVLKDGRWQYIDQYGDVIWQSE